MVEASRSGGGDTLFIGVTGDAGAGYPKNACIGETNGNRRHTRHRDADANARVLKR